MTTRLRPAQTLLVGSLIFGLYFGAGNLIFPVQLGRDAGSATAAATIGFLLTAVGLPILGIIASALARARDVFEMARPVGRRYALVFTCLLYLTIGPLFAIPRTATVSYEVGVRPLLSPGADGWALPLFSLVFFALTAVLAWRPGKLLDWVGRYLTPIFLVLLGALIAAAIISPMSRGAAPAPVEPYADGALSAGLLDGYNTMDALASLAFAIVIVEALRRLGVTRPSRIAVEVGKAGLIGGAGMALVYAALAYVGVTSLGVVQGENGGSVLAGTSNHYYGVIGQYLVAAIVLVACLKTAVGLIAACAEMFVSLFASGPKYRGWLALFVTTSLLVANAGLETIIAYSIPVLMFLYPLAIITILLGLLHHWVGNRRPIHVWATALTGVAALFDLLKALPEPWSQLPLVQNAVHLGGSLPGFESGFGWVAPALLGLIIGALVSTRTPAADTAVAQEVR
ncbi:branched-chain amino acid transport system II carrier protein [Gephyromycinifex aptenodytis]|uniref:branched-chain amino acid transport system II carrier protein n=1 Tax=Gephyromycinifex aptenodytis TaxID=2716227 RepID=UPI001444F9FF|nr:branched-chain amino acid transport system II carrier protein [Gephyromycinifex aptenodytis]